MLRYLSKVPTKADWIVPFIIAALTALGTTYVKRTDASVALEKRVTVLETDRSNDVEKLDHIQSQVDKLVEWALGR